MNPGTERPPEESVEPLPAARMAVFRELEEIAPYASGTNHALVVAIEELIVAKLDERDAKRRSPRDERYK